MHATLEQGTQTIKDFGDQWSRYPENQGWYASLDLFRDIVSPLIDIELLKNKEVAEIGSGTGRIIGMLTDAHVRHAIAIEPSPEAFRVLVDNITDRHIADKVTPLNITGDAWKTDRKVDYIFSIGVIHHIPEPEPVIKAAFDALKPGGTFFMWLYGYEGNERYLAVTGILRKFTTRMPHLLLKIVVDICYGALVGYRFVSLIMPLPLSAYIKNVLWPMTPQNRRLVIYDQLNPTHSKYYKKEEAYRLLETAGFRHIELHHRHGYSWSVIGRKPFDD
jgi:SAM-dependent methyltransferase